MVRFSIPVQCQSLYSNGYKPIDTFAIIQIIIIAKFCGLICKWYNFINILLSVS